MQQSIGKDDADGSADEAEDEGFKENLLPNAFGGSTGL